MLITLQEGDAGGFDWDQETNEDAGGHRDEKRLFIYCNGIQYYHLKWYIEPIILRHVYNCCVGEQKFRVFSYFLGFIFPFLEFIFSFLIFIKIFNDDEF